MCITGPTRVADRSYSQRREQPALRPGTWRRRGRRTLPQKPRPEDIPDRPVSLRRVARLFRPYRLRLNLLLALIFLGAVLSVASPFLLREAVDRGIDKHDLTLLSWLVAA